jgi:hypothetical protein
VPFPTASNRSDATGISIHFQTCRRGIDPYFETSITFDKRTQERCHIPVPKRRPFGESSLEVRISGGHKLRRRNLVHEFLIVRSFIDLKKLLSFG